MRVASFGSDAGSLLIGIRHIVDQKGGRRMNVYEGGGGDRATASG